MDRAEKAANEYYYQDNNGIRKNCFIAGFRQAEKDLALTWEDIKMIDEIMTDVATEHVNKGIDNTEEYYSEVLRKFNEQRNEKE